MAPSEFVERGGVDLTLEDINPLPLRRTDNERTDTVSNTSRESSEVGSSSEMGMEASEGDEMEPEHSFPQFQKLPPELRRRVWELFCPDLMVKTRILKFDALWQHSKDPSVWFFSDSMEMTQVTAAVRRVSAVHRESRGIVTARYPNVLSFRASYGDLKTGYMRYNPARDIIMFSGVDRPWPGHDDYDGFCGEIGSVAFDVRFLEDFLEFAPSFIRAFKNLKNVYMCGAVHEFGRANRRWCASPLAHCYRMITVEIEPGFGEDTEKIYVWPDWATAGLPPIAKAMERFKALLPQEFKAEMDDRDIQVGPMVLFEDADLKFEYEVLVNKYLSGDAFDPDNMSGSSVLESDFTSSEDEYESEGIDDTEQAELEESSEDEDVPRAVLEGEDTEDDEDDEDDGEDDTAVDAEGAQFSSPEAESDGGADRDSAMVRGRKRRIVEDSDDEDQSVQSAGPSRKKARRGGVVLSSDSEEGNDDDQEEDQPSRKRVRRAPVAVSSDSEEEAGNNDTKASLNTSAAQDNSDNSTTTSTEESSDDEDAEPSRRPGIAAVLGGAPKQERRNVFQAPSTDDENEEGSDASDIVDFDDDDQEEEDEEDREQRYGSYGLIDDEASDGDESEGYDDDEY